MRSRILGTLFLLQLAAISVAAQATEFTYQVQLQNASADVVGWFDFRCALVDAAAVGQQLGSTQTRSGVAVTNGIFSVNLVFGPVFRGAHRFRGIRLRQSGGGSFTTLAPR